METDTEATARRADPVAEPRRAGTAETDHQPAPTAATRPAAPEGRPAGDVLSPAPAAPVEAGPRRAGARRNLKDALAVLLATASIVAGLALALLPYERSLTGYLEGTRRSVAATCDAAATSAFTTGSDVLAGDGTWAGAPPCQRTSAYRLGLAGMLIAAGAVGAGLTVYRRREQGVRALA